MTKKISPHLVAEAILAEAKALKRKKEIFEELKKFNTELSAINEVGMVGSFGFNAPNDVVNKTKTGFVEPQSLSFVKQLMDDMKEEEVETTPESDEAKALKEENENLKKELEALKGKSNPAA